MMQEMRLEDDHHCHLDANRRLTFIHSFSRLTVVFFFDVKVIIKPIVLNLWFGWNFHLHDDCCEVENWCWCYCCDCCCSRMVDDVQWVRDAFLQQVFSTAFGLLFEVRSEEVVVVLACKRTRKKRSNEYQEFLSAWLLFITSMKRFVKCNPQM